MKILVAMWGKERQRWLLYIAMIIAFTISINCIGGVVTIENNELLKENQNQNFHILYDNYVGEIEREFFKAPDNIQKLKDFNKWLSNSDYFDYICINRQGIALRPSGTSYESIQVNDTFFQYNNVIMEQGSLFDEADYTINSLSDRIPVLIGGAFSNEFSIGDQISFYYMGDKLLGEVKGILRKNSSFLFRDNIELMDELIVLPSLIFENNPSSEIERSFQLKLYLDKNGGIIVSGLSAQYISQKISEICLEYDLVPYGIEEQMRKSVNVWGKLGKELRETYLFFTVFLLFITMLCYVIESLNKVQKLKRNYSIAYTNGFSKMLIKISSAIGIFYELFYCLSIAVIIDLATYKNYYSYGMMLLYVFFLFVITFLICNCTMNHKYWLDIRGGKYGNNTA